MNRVIICIIMDIIQGQWNIIDINYSVDENTELQATSVPVECI